MVSLKQLQQIYLLMTFPCCISYITQYTVQWLHTKLSLIKILLYVYITHLNVDVLV